jgi:hypothetical protein
MAERKRCICDKCGFEFLVKKQLKSVTAKAPNEEIKIVFLECYKCKSKYYVTIETSEVLKLKGNIEELNRKFRLNRAYGNHIECSHLENEYGKLQEQLQILTAMLQDKYKGTIDEVLNQ